MKIEPATVCLFLMVVIISALVVEKGFEMIIDLVVGVVV